MPIEINEMYDFWLVASNLNQSLATVFGILGNALLLYMIRFVSLGEMKVLIPLLRVHSVVGILQTLLNASAYARIFIIHGQFFVVLTGSFITEDPWRSILLTSVVWVALFELFLSIINNFYRYLLVCRDFQPTTFFVVLLAFGGLLLSFTVGVVYMTIVTKIGPSNDTQIEEQFLDRFLSFWPNNSLPFLVGDPAEIDFFAFMGVTFGVFLVSCLIVGFMALRIHKSMMERRARQGGRQANALRYNRIMNSFVTVVAAVPFAFYCIPVVAAWLLATSNINAPHLGLLIGVPFVWVPALKSIAIILVLPPWRKGFRYCWKRWNSHENSVHTIRPRHSNNGNKSKAEKSEVSRNDSKIMY